MPNVIYNHKLTSKNDVIISMDDRSFKFGDGCFETIPVYNAHCLCLAEHLKRLQQGLNALKIRLDLSKVSNEINVLLLSEKIDRGFVRITVSRGEGSTGFLPHESARPYYIIEANENTAIVPKEVRLHLSETPKISVKQLPVHTKLNQGLNSILARLEAKENHCFESLQCTTEGYISEGSSSNIVWLKKRTLYTPDISCDLLPGITLNLLKTLSPFPIIEGRFFPQELTNAEEIWLTNSAWEILPVTEIPQLNRKLQTNEGFKMLNRFRENVQKRTFSP